MEETLKGLSNDVEEYLQVVNHQIVIECLYDKYLNITNEDVKNKLLDFLLKLHLIDYEKVIAYLNSNEFKTQKSGLQLLQVYKYSYGNEDKETLRKLVDIIQEVFRERGSRTTKKKVLSSKEKEIWVCECGKENDSEDFFCNSCHKDILGFSRYDMNPKEVIEKLRLELEILDEAIV